MVGRRLNLSDILRQFPAHRNGALRRSGAVAHGNPNFPLAATGGAC